jgi:hypothetical protein
VDSFIALSHVGLFARSFFLHAAAAYIFPFPEVLLEVLFANRLHKESTPAFNLCGKEFFECKNYSFLFFVGSFLIGFDFFPSAFALRPHLFKTGDSFTPSTFLSHPFSLSHL